MGSGKGNLLDIYGELVRELIVNGIGVWGTNFETVASRSTSFLFKIVKGVVHPKILSFF